MSFAEKKTDLVWPKRVAPVSFGGVLNVQVPENISWIDYQSQDAHSENC